MRLQICYTVLWSLFNVVFQHAFPISPAHTLFQDKSINPISSNLHGPDVMRQLLLAEPSAVLRKTHTPTLFIKWDKKTDSSRLEIHTCHMSPRYFFSLVERSVNNSITNSINTTATTLAVCLHSDVLFPKLLCRWPRWAKHQNSWSIASEDDKKMDCYHTNTRIFFCFYVLCTPVF